MYSRDISNIALNVILIASFLCVFFFTYAARVEEQIVKNQMEYLVSNLFQNVDLLPQSTKTKLKSVISTAELPDLSKEDEKVYCGNNKLMRRTLTFIGILLFIVITIVFILSRIYNFDFISIFKMNVITLFFVALTEFCFLTFVASNYISADTNSVRRSFITATKKLNQSL